MSEKAMLLVKQTNLSADWVLLRQFRDRLVLLGKFQTTISTFPQTIQYRIASISKYDLRYRVASISKYDPKRDPSNPSSYLSREWARRGLFGSFMYKVKGGVRQRCFLCILRVYRTCHYEECSEVLQDQGHKQKLNIKIIK